MSKKSTSDHAIAIGKAAAQFVPILGGAIASLVDDYVPTSAEKSREKTMQLLNEKLSSLEDRIDTNHIDKDQFSELYESCQLLATRNRREEKLRAAASMMANFLLRPGDPA